MLLASFILGNIIEAQISLADGFKARNAKQNIQKINESEIKECFNVLLF